MNWLNKYKEKLGIRYTTFHSLFEIAHKEKLSKILETGTARGKKKFIFSKPNWKDGMSTLLFAEYTKLNGGQFWSCDIDSKNISNAKKFISSINDKVNFVISDSLLFLKEFDNLVDIIYLDSLDGSIDGCAEHQLEEAKLSLKIINNNGLILLDDKGQKTTLSTEFLLNNNCKIVKENDAQLLFRYENSLY
tara:strand:- start:2792 stop:3364 length:573 start_codon:yes stop_codon:yes gene_type:complete